MSKMTDESGQNEDNYYNQEITPMFGEDDSFEIDSFPGNLPNNIVDDDIVERLMRAKRGNPSAFASYWEMDENDVDEATEEEIELNPVKRMLWAAEKNNLEVLEEMYKRDETLIHCKDEDGYSPLHRASYEGNKDAMQFLLARGADVNGKTNDLWTPLHSACRWDQTEAASILLGQGAHINAQTEGKQTALHLSSANVNGRNTLELLLTHNDIDPSLKNSVGETAYEICLRTGPAHTLFEIVDESINKLEPT